MANAVYRMRALAIVTLLAVVLLLSLPHLPASRVLAESQEDELARLRTELDTTRAENARLSAELNASQAALEDAQGDRDAYAERLESSTIILVMALVLISIATAFFWLTARRQAIVMRDVIKGEGQRSRRPRHKG